MTLTDFTLSNARRFYSSMGNCLTVKGLMIITIKELCSDCGKHLRHTHLAHVLPNALNIVFKICSIMKLINFCVEFNSCDALDPDDRTWGSVLQSMVKRSNVIDNLVFKLSPFKTSCFAVDGKLFNARWSAKFHGNFLKCDLSHENVAHSSLFVTTKVTGIVVNVHHI